MNLSDIYSISVILIGLGICSCILKLFSGFLTKDDRIAADEFIENEIDHKEVEDSDE